MNKNENTFSVYTVIEVKPENNTEFAEFIKNRAEASFNENGTLLVYVGLIEEVLINGVFLKYLLIWILI